MKTIKILSIAFFALLVLASCTKLYDAPAFFDVQPKAIITAEGISLDGSYSYDTKSTILQYVWHVSKLKDSPSELDIPAIRVEGKFASVDSIWNKYYVQLSVLDDKGNSHAEYITVTR